MLGWEESWKRELELEKPTLRVSIGVFSVVIWKKKKEGK